MENKKQVIFEVILYIIFFISNLVLYRGIIHFSSFWLSFASISFVLVINISLLAFYSTIKASRSNTIVFILIHILVIALMTLFYGMNILTFSIVGITALIVAIFFGAYLRQIDIEIKERLTYHPNRIVFPHIRQIILCFILISTGLFYIQMYSFYDESKSEIKISETFIKSQVKLLDPLIKRAIPNFTEESTIGEIIEGNVQKQLDKQTELVSEDLKKTLKQNPELKGINLDKLKLDTKLTIENQIEEINNQFELEDKIKYDTNVITGLGQILNNFIKDFVNVFLDSNKFALILTGLFFSTFSILIPIYGILIKLIIMALEKLAFELEFVKIKSETKQKETITY